MSQFTRFLKVPFVQTQTKDSFLSSRLRRKTTPFVHTQTKDSFPSSILREKTTSFRPDSDESQLPFFQTQTKDSFLSFRLRQNTTFFRLDPDDKLLLCVQSKKTFSHLVQIQTKLMLQKTALFVLCRILASKGALYMTLCYYREGSTPQLFQISESKSMKELLRPSMCYIFIFAYI